MKLTYSNEITVPYQCLAHDVPDGALFLMFTYGYRDQRRGDDIWDFPPRSSGREPWLNSANWFPRCKRLEVEVIEL